ncbi:hypothetical protein [Candidatus Desulfosporosinus nitrosoreducens]|uniref:hypothetical protein n=1 Tax=Candidatus Desulfosporosinus nitrosoreducens TaxID=3401928 RepID=UPI00280B5CFA|nr:hypothetical protein [Desulfosporosinus sp. PR]
MIPAKSNTNKTRRFRAEIWDQLQYFFQEYNDHQLHGVIYFKDLLDWEAIKKAVILSIDIVPLLNSRFVLNCFRPYWQGSGNYQEQDVISLSYATKPDQEINRFLTAITNELTGPQLKATVVRCSGKDALCIVMNHMVCDGAGFKEYLYLLAALYTRQYVQDTAPLNFIYGSRSSRQIYRQLNFMTKLKLFFLPNEPLQNRNDIYFPLSQESGQATPYILKHKMPPELFCRLKKYGRDHAVTINDIILAAYYRALYNIVDIAPGNSLTIPCMVDLRRYLPDKKADGICNLSSMILCHIGSEIGDSLEDTIKKVNRAMQAKKQGFPGMHGLATLNLLFRFLPFSMVKKIIKKNYVNPLIGMTNIGIIDSNRLRFGNLFIEDAFVTGSIKYFPYFQLALTTYNNSITFSFNFYGFEQDIETIKRFFKLLDDELNKI